VTAGSQKVEPQPMSWVSDSAAMARAVRDGVVSERSGIGQEGAARRGGKEGEGGPPRA